MNSLNTFFFVMFPYISVAVLLIGTTYRYRQTGFKVTSLSAQFLEGKQGFWGTVPFHWGILMIFLGHMVAFLFPTAVLAWNSDPARLIVAVRRGPLEQADGDAFRRVDIHGRG